MYSTARSTLQHLSLRPVIVLRVSKRNMQHWDVNIPYYSCCSHPYMCPPVFSGLYFTPRPIKDHPTTTCLLLSGLLTSSLCPADVRLLAMFVIFLSPSSGLSQLGLTASKRVCRLAYPSDCTLGRICVSRIACCESTVKTLKPVSGQPLAAKGGGFARFRRFR